MHVVIRYAGSAPAAADAVHRAVTAVDPLVPVTIAPLQERATASLGGRRVLLTLALAFGAIALVLTSVGVYALVAFAVAQHARESAIRLALGAHPSSVMRRATRTGVAPALAGIAVGLIGAVWLGGALQSQLFHVRPHDPAVLAVAALAVLSAASLAAAIPARRASRVDPVATLRLE
jgi:ABC-type antimicrobial peptide transport system permease subunit